MSLDWDVDIICQEWTDGSVYYDVENTDKQHILPEQSWPDDFKQILQFTSS